jgi:hypothetical protein
MPSVKRFFGQPGSQALLVAGRFFGFRIDVSAR